MKWPDGKKFAVMVTFDFDAESMWFSEDPTAMRKPSILSQGTYGPRRGIHKVLETLRYFEVPASFYVPGWTADKHPGAIEAVLKHGHEVGHHGHMHAWIDPDDPDGEIEEMDKGLEALKKLGVVPKGYRAPAASSSEMTLELVRDRGFLYNSGFLDDVYPYRHTLVDGSKGPVELPFHWNLDDSAITYFNFDTQPGIFPNAHILDVWKEEINVIREWGALANITLHPQLIGRPSRMTLFKHFLDYIQSFDDVWFATGTQVAEAFETFENTQEQ
ncbi:MAG: polysaccharide deacetylase [Rhodospirillales bacterium]|nr:polysaccharide deacetylase [Rhodospirillales bacterium]